MKDGKLVYSEDPSTKTTYATVEDLLDVDVHATIVCWDVMRLVFDFSGRGMTDLPSCLSKLLST